VNDWAQLKTVVVFASGSGSNFEAIVDQLHGRAIGGARCDIALLVCDQPGAGCLDRAERLGIPTFTVQLKDFTAPKDAAGQLPGTAKQRFEQAILERLDAVDPDIIALAGYMKIVGPTLLDRYQGKIVNIHPALLPAFPGADGIGDALRFGAKVLGVTVHYVDAGVDTGEIIDQAALHLLPGESEAEVRERIHALEHELYPRVIADLLGAGGQPGANAPSGGA